MGKVLQIVCMVMILVIVTGMTNAQAGTLGFYLKGVAYPDGSTVLSTDIGEGAYAALQCTTDSTTCCTNVPPEMRDGEFYMPNGSIVPPSGTTINGYYRTRGSWHILLNHRSYYYGTITGWFRCHIPQANGPTADLYINIVDILITITPSGDNTAGDSYSLMCSATVIGSGNQPIITWLSPTNMIVGNVSTQTLNFNPLTASDAGRYTCRATLGSIEQTADVNIIVMNPRVTVSVSGDAAPVAGMMLTLTCNIVGADMITNPTIIYQWFKNGHVVSDQTERIFSFSSLAYSDRGQYFCAVDISATILPSTISSISAALNVRLSLPDPTVRVTAINSLDSPITSGIDVTLTCTVELSTNLRSVSSVGVNVTWTGPTGTLSSTVLSGTSPPTYTDTLMLSGVISNGTYTCHAMIDILSTSPYVLSSGSMSDDITIIIVPVRITSTPVSPIRPIGSNVTLTCTVDLSQLLDIPVTVTTQISGPLSVVITPITNSVMESSTRYTSTATVGPFERDLSGEYTCMVTVELVTANALIIGMDKITIGTGVYLSLKGVVYANNSAIQISEIGKTNSTSNTGLQCITDRMPCCAAFGFRAGEWFFPDGTTVPPQGRAMTFYRNRGDDGAVNLNRLNTNVLMPNGLFCCEVSNATGDTQPLCANIGSIFVVITPTGTSTAGQTYSLDCSVTGTTDPATYQWFNSIGTQLSSTSQLQFSPLLASHAGTYTCRATVGSVVLENSDMVEINFPAPSAVTVTAPLGVIAGASVTLTCAVELSPAVNVPVTVNTEWTGPADVMFVPANPVPAVMVNITIYVSTVSVGAARSGSYNCQAIAITFSGTTSGSVNITIAPLPPPTNLRAVTTTPTSITLTWEQPEGADAVDRYEINYRYFIEECELEGGRPFPSVTVPVNDGTLRRFTLNNSASTPVEEDSLFRITLTAVNNVTRSVPSQPAMTTTTETAPGLVQSLSISSVNVTSITIRWDRVDCQERNGYTDSYRLIYYPASDPSVRANAYTVLGTGVDNRIFRVSGVPPQTNYTFEVQTSNPNVDLRGPPAFYTISTTAPQDLGFLLDGQLYGNNSVVTVTDIGSSFFISALFCLTPILECCSDSETPNAASVTREWYLPDGRPLTSDNSPFIKSRVSSAVSLHRDRFSFNTAPTGVYRCEIPDASGASQNIYVGIYHRGDGSLSIISLLFDRNSTTLTCTSTGGPPTTVTWRKNGVPVDLSLYEQSQRLVNALEATYQNVLFNDNVTNFVGTFTCEVSNVRVTTPVQDTLDLNGVSIVRDQFSVGESATASCKSDAPALMIEWLRDGMVVESAAFTGIQELDLVFSPVNDSIHTQVYVCRVTRDGGDGMTVIAVQNFTVNIDVPPNAITATISSSGTATAGMVYSLTCNIFKTVGGLTDSPTATWTTGGVAVNNGNGVTVTGTTGDVIVTSTLTFDPLRTSHEGSFVCRGTLTSPALHTALIPSTTQVLEIQISTPDVVVTVPPGPPLFAGHIAPLALTCTISVNSATDTDIEVSDMDITWLRGSTHLSNDDARVTISPVSGSRPSFTISLTLDPLSTADNTTFTCQARARPPTGVSTLVTTSEMGEGTTSVIVNLPSPPTVSIDPLNRLEMAGQPLTLTCSASIQEGIRGTPVLTWTREDASLSSDVGSAPPLLSFPSLRTSHAGRYTCTARLSISEAGVDISGDRTTNVSIQFMSPPPIISGFPRNTSFFQGLDLTFICSITLGDVVDTPVTIWGIWNRNGTELMDGDENRRITIINPPMSSPSYNTILRVNPLNVTDAGMYECNVTITPQDTVFISTATISNSRAIRVFGFPTQIVSVTAGGISIAGFSGYALICNTSREPDLPPTSTLAVQWLGPRSNVISSGENFTISGVGPTTDARLISRLIFNSLYTSQAGNYTCRTIQTVPGIVVNHSEPVTFRIQVKLPPPISPLPFRHSRNTTLNAGTSFSLTCIISPNTTGVDTDIIVESSIVGNGISDTNRVSISPLPVSVGENTFETTVTFSHLLEADAGEYNCSAYIRSPPSLPNVITSDSTSGSESISVGPLQAPTISVSPTQGISVEAGGQDTITCTSTFDEYLVERPTLMWEFPQGSGTVDTTMGDQLGIRGNTTRTLIFNRIRTSQAGVYTCRATIDIQGINSLSRITSRTVRVQIPCPAFSVLPHPTAYNGTNLTIIGRIQQDSNVDTDVTISGTWSSGTSSIVTTAQIMLSLLPVATDSSGEYTMTYTIRSSDNSPHIIEYNGTYSYNLAVAPLPSRPPTISVVSRHQLDGCGEVMTLNCTSIQLENLFSPPSIVWVAPGGSEVPTIESSNPRMNPQTRELIFSDITLNNRGQYACRSVVNILQAHIDNYTFGTDTVQVNTDFPGRVRNLVCAVSSSPSELSFSWDLPTLLGSEVVSYQVIVNRLEHRPGTREVIQSAVDEQFIKALDARITGLAAEVPYSVTVKAINLAGCGEENQTYCFTQEGVPPPPENVVVVRFNPTSIGVSWNKFTLVELKGLATYIVTYTIIIDSRKRQNELGGTVTIPWTQNQAVISGLQSGAEYDVTIRTSTAAGMSAPVRPGNRISIATPSSSDNTVTIIGGVVVAVVLIIAATIAVIVIVLVALILRNRKAQFSPNQKPLPYEAPDSVMLSDLSPTNKERQVYETIDSETTDHEYEILDKYNHATYEDIKLPPPAKPQPAEAEAVQLQPMASTGDYDFTQCPAYVSMATTNIHGNTNKSAETPLTQPTAAQE